MFTSYAAIYAAVAERYDLEFVPPFDATILATSIGALAEGFAIRDHVTPELVPDDMPRPTGPDGAVEPWHLFACGVEALVRAFTRPRSGNGPEKTT